MTAAQPGSGNGFQANGISVANAASWSVGGVTQSGNRFTAMAEYWDGTQWQLGNPALVSDKADTWLSHVKVFPTGSTGEPEAWAVGMTQTVWNQYRMLIEHWVGPDPKTPWEIAPPPAVTGKTELLGISGSDPSDIWAVGLVISKQWSPLAVHWDGTSWTTSATATLPGDTTGAELMSVTATSPSDVWAVGWQTKGFGYGPLVEHFDGTSWTIVPSSGPGSAENVLIGSASAGPGDFWAVGYQSDGTSQQPLAMHYQSGTWSVVATAAVGGPVGVLRSVTVAPASSQVWAAGTQLDPTIDRAFRPMTEVADLTSASPVFTAVPTAISAGKTVGTEFHDITADPVSGQVFATGYNLPALVQTICPVTGSVAPHAASSRGLPDPDVSGSGGPPAPVLRRTSEGAGTSSGTPVTKPHEAVGGATLTLATDVTAQAMGPLQPTKTTGAAIGDFAGPTGPGPDGYPDFEVNSRPMMLWVNQGDGTWKSANSSFPQADRFQCSWGDVAGPTGWGPDGLQDLFCSHGADKGRGIKENEFWVQQTDGSFANQVTSLNGLDPFGRGRTAAMFYAGDTTAPGPHPLSLFLGQDIQRVDGMPNPNRFFLNEGGALVDDPAAGLDRELGGLCAQPIDFNQDNYTDLLVCTVFKSGLTVYQNNGPVGPGGTPTFTAVAKAANAQFGLMADFNGDGCSDLAEVFATRVDVLLQTVESSQCGGGFTAPVWSHPLIAGRWAAAGDVNGDGAPDLFVMQTGYGNPHFMFLDDGTGTSFDSIPVPEPTVGQGESVWSIPNPGTALTDFLVLDGNKAPGQTLLTRFVPNPTPNPLNISSGPSDPTSETTATFEFSTTESGVSFVCSLDGADPVPCASGITYTGLGSGPHRFAVWTVAAQGSTAEATWPWTIP
jgi:hypothetical protein